MKPVSSSSLTKRTSTIHDLSTGKIWSPAKPKIFLMPSTKYF